jgi:predicted enzyme related to lactoylglutathione lyase
VKAWFEIPVKDMDASKKFYAKVFGWQFSEQNGMTFLTDGEGNFGHFWPLKGKLAKTPQVRLYMTAESIAPMLKKAVSAGGSVVTPKTKLPSGMGSIAEFTDPIGVVWGLHSAK